MRFQFLAISCRLDAPWTLKWNGSKDLILQLRMVYFTLKWVSINYKIYDTCCTAISIRIKMLTISKKYKRNIHIRNVYGIQQCDLQILLRTKRKKHFPYMHQFRDQFCERAKKNYRLLCYYSNPSMTITGRYYRCTDVEIQIPSEVFIHSKCIHL